MSRSDYGMECPVCWLDFDDTDNTPHVLWCGHSLCRNCVLGLKTAVMRRPFLPPQLPFLIACPLCQYRTLKYPCKNYFLVGIVESRKADKFRQRSQVDLEPTVTPTSVGSLPSVARSLPSRHFQAEQQQRRPIRSFLGEVLQGRWNLGDWQLWLTWFLAGFVHVIAKLPLVLLFLFIVCCVVPFSGFILAIYSVVTMVFAGPSILAVYVSFPSIDWLARKIMT